MLSLDQSNAHPAFAQAVRAGLAADARSDNDGIKVPGHCSSPLM
jgi:hypothetical protein